MGLTHCAHSFHGVGGGGWSFHPVYPFKKAESITLKQKFFATQDEKTHGERGVQQSMVHALPYPFLLKILELLKLSFDEDLDGFFSSERTVLF